MKLTLKKLILLLTMFSILVTVFQYQHDASLIETDHYEQVMMVHMETNYHYELSERDFGETFLVPCPQTNEQFALISPDVAIFSGYQQPNLGRYLRPPTA